MGSATSTRCISPTDRKQKTENGSATSSATQNSKPTGTAMPIVSVSTDGDNAHTTILRTNQVAPIIIKNCNEEFQHVSDFKDPIVYSSLIEGAPGHPLVQGKYFLVKDIHTDDDKLKTLSLYLAPNCRQAGDGFPVYGMGQPTKDGLASFMEGLKSEDANQMILLFNLRHEPVLFLREEFDMVPYSPRVRSCVHDPDTGVERLTLRQTTDLEVDIRKEVIDLAALKDDLQFYFYDDAVTFKDEPHQYQVAFEDDLGVTEEVYCQQTFYNFNIRYLRLGWTQAAAPTEADFDAFVSEFRALPNYVSQAHSRLPLVVFTSHLGLIRCTYGMCLGMIMLAHKRGFPKAALKTPPPLNDENPKFEMGEYFVIRELVRSLPQGLKFKAEVDVVINECSELFNPRSAILDSKNRLESLADDLLQVEVELQVCLTHLERYFYLICFNAYLHEAYCTQFGEAFSQWMRRHPHIYTILKLADISERRAPLDLLCTGERVLVADDYIGLDVLSSNMDVKVSNFRRVPGLPIYGMAQPSMEGLTFVVRHLLHTKQGHPLVIWFNLREDLVIECSGQTYSPREAKYLEEPLIMSGISSAEIEEKEVSLKNVLRSKTSWQVYTDLDQKPETREFTDFRTCVEMYEELTEEIPELSYHRLPMADDAAPSETIFDYILSVIVGLTEIYTDEDGPALLFQCRTGKGRTTTAMAIAGLVICHLKGFPYGTKPGEEERVSLPNAKYTQGHYRMVQEVVRRIPNGHQVKREVDFILNQCSDTMTPMHYHIREVIFVTFNKIKNAKTDRERSAYRKRSLEYLERYVYLIIFNSYLHGERRSKWQRSFKEWLTEVANNSALFEILDSLTFADLEPGPFDLMTRRDRWLQRLVKHPRRGQFV